MGYGMLRFECRRELSGTWAVWDNERGSTAVLGGCSLGVEPKTEPKPLAASCVASTAIDWMHDQSSPRP